MYQKLAILLALGICLQGVDAIGHKASHKMHQRSEGIFGRMIEQVTAGEKIAQERHQATERKKQQLAEAERQYQQQVEDEEREEAERKKKEEMAAEQAAFEAAKNSPAARLLQATNEAASSINMSEIEANIQASLQAKLNAGASRADLLAQAGEMDYSSFAQTSKNNINTQSVINSVLNKNKIQQQITTTTETAPATTQALGQVEQKASQEKVREMAQKLQIPFTQDLMNLGSNSAISDALIEKAVAAGKTEAQINAAMATL